MVWLSALGVCSLWEAVFDDIYAHALVIAGMEKMGVGDEGCLREGFKDSRLFERALFRGLENATLLCFRLTPQARRFVHSCMWLSYLRPYVHISNAGYGFDR